MRERLNFVGPGRTDKEESLASFSIAQKRVEANRFHESELEKTPEERAAIELLSSLLQEEFQGLEIAEIPEIRENRFHIMTDEWFDKNRPKWLMGNYFPFEDSAFFCRGRFETPLQLYKTMFHEGVHAVSHQKHWLDVPGKRVNEYRVGYQVANTAKRGEEHTHLEAFNEGVTEMTVEHMFHKYRQDIMEKFSVSTSDLKDSKFSYPLFRGVVNNICEGLASYENDENIRPMQVWERIKRGQFTGEMMHLRDIERTYGRGALKILDALQSEFPDIGSVDDDSFIERNEKVYEYFENYDRPEEDRGGIRQRIAREILGEEAYAEYCL